jgi:hypothetical protein
LEEVKVAILLPQEMYMVVIVVVVVVEEQVLAVEFQLAISKASWVVLLVELKVAVVVML